MPSLEETAAFVATDGFARFANALSSDGMISQSRAFRFWNARRRSETQPISKLLLEVCWRSNLSNGDPRHLKVDWPENADGIIPPYDLDDPEAYCGRTTEPRPPFKDSGLLTVRADCLLPDSFVGVEPVHKCRVGEIDYSTVSNLLLKRIPDTAAVTSVRIYVAPATVRFNDYHPDWTWRRWDGWRGIPFPKTQEEINSNFSKTVLSEFRSAPGSEQIPELGQIEIIRLLGSERFLTSDNMHLFTGAIADSLPNASEWRINSCGSLDDQDSILAGPAHATYRNRAGQLVHAVFAGCLTGEQLRSQMRFAEGELIEFW